MKKNTYNIVITNLSTVAQAAIAQYFRLEGDINEKLLNMNENLYGYDNIEVRGVMTNEAGIKYIIQKLRNENDSLDSILFIKSDTTAKLMSFKENNDIKHADITHIEFFKKRLEIYTHELGLKTPSYLVEDGMHIDDDPSPEALINLSANIANKIIKLKEDIGNDKQINLYIESNGGIRDFMLVVVAIIQSISKNFATVKEVVGVNFIHNNLSHPIRDKTQAYRVYDLYSGIDEFINYGRSNKISYFFKDLKLKNEEKVILNSIELMSIAFTLCKPLEMLKATKDLSEAIDKYEELEKRSDIFNLLVNRIQTEYQHIFDDIRKGDIHDYSVLKDLIQHCIKHNLIQQALTLYSELMPDIMYNKKIFYPSIKKFNEETLEIIFNKYYEKTFTRKDQSKGYAYIQNYMLIKKKDVRDGDIRRLYDMGLINIYNSQCKNKSNKLKYWEKSENLRILLENNYISTQCKNYDIAIQIMKDYLNIKEERNKSNHASVSRGTIDDLNSELHRIIEILIKSMINIDQALNE